MRSCCSSKMSKPSLAVKEVRMPAPVVGNLSTVPLAVRLALRYSRRPLFFVHGERRWNGKRRDVVICKGSSLQLKKDMAQHNHGGDKGGDRIARQCHDGRCANCAKPNGATWFDGNAPKGKLTMGVQIVSNDITRPCGNASRCDNQCVWHCV